MIVYTSTMIINLNEQQLAIWHVLAAGLCCYVNSCSGAGKSLTSFYCAQQVLSKSKTNKVLMLVYNTNLSVDSKKLKDQYGLDRLDVFTYHAALAHFSGQSCKDDIEMHTILSTTIMFVEPVEYDMVVMDEQQDMSPLLYMAACKLLQLNKKRDPLLLCLGDEHQTLFRFKGADHRALTMAPRLFQRFNTRPWSQRNIDISMRVPRKVADFVNYVVGETRINAVKPGGKVTYVRGDMTETGPFLDRVKDLIKTHGDQVLILARSVKAFQVKIFENNLAQWARIENRERTASNKIHIYAPPSDKSDISEKVLRKKVSIMTFHQCKGLTRKAIVILGFDGKQPATSSPPVCDDPMYVAMTRCSEELLLLHQDREVDREPFFPTVDPAVIMSGRLCNYVGPLNRPARPQKQKVIRDKNFSVSELLSHLPTDTVLQVMDLIPHEGPFKFRDSHLNFETEINTTYKTFESVASFIGDIATAVCELEVFGTCRMLDTVERAFKNHSPRVMTTLEAVQKHGSLPLTEAIMPDICRLAVAADSVDSWSHRRFQINKFDWFDAKTADAMKDRVKHFVSFDDQIIFEKSYEMEQRVHGRVDIIDWTNRKVLEVKTTQDHKPEHLLQLACYKHIMQEDSLDMDFVLVNVKRGEYYDLTATDAQISKAVDLMIKAKHSSDALLNDDELLNSFSQRTEHL